MPVQRTGNLEKPWGTRAYSTMETAFRTECRRQPVSRFSSRAWIFHKRTWLPSSIEATTESQVTEPRNCADPNSLGLLHRVDHVEDRQVHRHHHATDNHAQEHDHYWLQKRQQVAHRCVDFLVVEISDLREHLVETTSLLTDGD